MINLTIETLKSSISLKSLIGEVVELRNGKGLCPFHTDRNPSLSVKEKRFRCFACGESGDALDFVKRYYGLDTRGAIRFLTNKVGLKSDRPAPVQITEDKERKELIAAFRVWEAETRNDIAEVLRRYRHMRATRKNSFSESELQELAYLQGEIDRFEYIYEEILCSDDDASKLKLFIEDI